MQRRGVMSLIGHSLLGQAVAKVSHTVLLQLDPSRSEVFEVGVLQVSPVGFERFEDS